MCEATAGPESGLACSRRRELGALFGAGLALSREGSAIAAGLPEEVFEHLKCAKRIVKLMNKGKYAATAELCSDEAFVKRLGPSELPYSGTYKGSTCIADFFQAFNEYFEVANVNETFFYLGEAGSIFAAFDYTFAVAGSGLKDTLDTTLAMKIKFDSSGKMVKMAIIPETLSEYLKLNSAGKL